MSANDLIDAGGAMQPFRSAAAEQNGILLGSEHRPFAHAEEAYDTQYAHEEPDPGPGRRLVEILREMGMSEGGRAFEFGCGTGYLSFGLAEAGYFSDLIVSDGSMKFVEIAKRKLETATSSTRTTYAVVQAEDVANLKDEFFDVIVMRSVLHHVTDFDAFVDLLMTKLTPNGAILFLEPRAESFFWMGTVIAILHRLSSALGVEFTDKERENIQLFLDTMTFYLRRDIDKSQGEDKYAFWQSEFTNMARRNGAWLDYYSESIAADPTQELFDYLKYCMSFPEELLAKLASLADSFRGDLAALLRDQPAPDLSGWFVLRRA